MAASCFALGSQSDKKAEQLMVRCIKCNFSVNVVAIISQLDPDEASYQTIKVERSRSGKVRHTVLGPLCMQGVCTIDDGKRSYMYMPDQRLVIDQDSQPRNGDIDRRVQLALRNYSFRIEGRCQVAGRAAFCVQATPRNSGLETRTYCVETRTAYPLRLVTTAPNGDTTVKFETKDIEFPRKLDESLFQMRTLGEVNTLQYQRPNNVDPEQAAEIVGFEPVMPRGLPLGFEVQEVQANNGQEWKSLILRLTDGLAKANVYQWKLGGKNPKLKSLEQSTMRDVHGVRLLLVSDLAPDLRDRLLSAFIKDSEK